MSAFFEWLHGIFARRQPTVDEFGEDYYDIS